MLFTTAIRAVIFDWGGTLTPWHDIDFDAEAAALAEAAVGGDSAANATALRQAADTVWVRSRDEQRSATVADIFAEAGLNFEESGLTAYREFWEPHTFTDPEVAPMWRRLKERGLKIGVLSNTVWPREWHAGWFERDGVADLIDGDVYSSEIPWTKPAVAAFRAAMAAVDETDPAACVYVGDRLYDDIWGAQQAGLRAVHVPHSTIPDRQTGRCEGTPDAVLHRLRELPEILANW